MHFSTWSAVFLIKYIFPNSNEPFSFYFLLLCRFTPKSQIVKSCFFHENRQESES